MLDIINRANHSLQYIYDKLQKTWLYFYIGDVGINVFYIRNGEILDRYYTFTSEIENDQDFQDFIKKYKNSYARFIINSNHVEIKHESLTVLDTFSKTDPVEKYCESNFSKSDIYAYKTYDIKKDQADVWKSVICYLEFNKVIDQCFHIIKNNSIKFAGLYFQYFLMQDIASYISKKENINLDDYIYTTISVTKVNGINISINHKGNILYSSNTEYPAGKKDEYIQGVIEQSLSDIWIKFKAYIEEGSFKKLNIFILPESLKTLLKNQDLKVDLNIFDESNNSIDNNFSDPKIINFSSLVSETQATSNLLKNYYFYNRIDYVLFKPFYVILSLMLLYFINIKVSDYYYRSKTIELYNQYYEVNEEIKTEGKKYPDVTNITQLVDIHKIKDLLGKEKITPFDFIEDFVKLYSNDIEINRIYWHLDANVLQDHKFTINFDITLNKTEPQLIIEQFNVNLNRLRAVYPDIEINFQRATTSENRQNLGNVIPLKVIAIGNKL
jgi:hypothetical protein